MNNVKKALVAALASSALILAGCGSAGAPVDKSDDGKLMKVDVFDSRQTTKVCKRVGSPRLSRISSTSN